MQTIWGTADAMTKVADGIISVSTPSHGGYVISEKRMAEMPEQYKVCSYTKDNHFEEDCSWCAVVLSWPAYFPADHVKAAQYMYDICYGPNRRAA